MDNNASYMELMSLVTKPSYIYILCMMLTNDLSWSLMDMENSNPHERLIPYEFSIIVSLMVTRQIDLAIPTDVNELMLMKSTTERIMREIHNSYINQDALQKLLMSMNSEEKNMASAELWDELDPNQTTESILYSGEGTYDFQFIDYLEKRYALDQDYLMRVHNYDLQSVKRHLVWLDSLFKNKLRRFRLIYYPDRKHEIEMEIRKSGLIADTNSDINKALFMCYLQQFVEFNENEGTGVLNIGSICSDVLDTFLITNDDIKERPEIVDFLDKFSFQHRDQKPDLNRIDHLYDDYLTYPVIKLSNKGYFIPLLLNLYRSAYERPFYLMIQDHSYEKIASANRGKTSEHIVSDMLVSVFGDSNVYRGVIIYKGRNAVSEIDVLCVADSYALIVQVKSKRLTTIAKHGNVSKFTEDFKSAFQDAYDQGLKCRKAVLSGETKLIDSDKKRVEVEIKEAYVLCLTTDDCASISYIISKNIDRTSSDPYPIALSIFDLEIFVYYLHNPELFLYYMRQRVNLDDRVHAVNEVGCLAHHLMKNLYLKSDVSDMSLDQTCALYIDKHYYASRKGIDMSCIEDAFNTRWSNPEFESLCASIRSSGLRGYIDVLFALFDMGSEARDINLLRMKTCENKTKLDGRIHTISIMPCDTCEKRTGFSFVSSRICDNDKATERLECLCEINKYKLKSGLWVGFGSNIETKSFIDFCYVNDAPWAFDPEMEETIASLEKQGFFNSKKRVVGRNEPCPCGSNLKYKKCCGRNK